MENKYSSEGSSDDEEWVEIQSPSIPSNNKQNKNLVDSVIVSTKDVVFSSSEVSPPTNQEGLLVASSSSPNQIQNQLNDGNGDPNVEIEDEGSVHRENKSTIVLGFERFKCRIVSVVSRMRKSYGNRFLWKVTIGRICFGGIFFLLGFLVYMKIQRRRRQAKLLEKRLQIQEKDQKISELLLEIAQLKDILSQQRRVPVLRV